MLQLVVGNVFTNYVGASESEVHALYNCLAYKVKNFEVVRKKMARYNPAMRNWDGTKSFLEKKQKRFQTGFIPRIKERLDSYGMKYEILDRRAVIEPHMANDHIPALHGIELRDYQRRTILDFFKHSRGVAKLATGAGKTEAAIAIFAKAEVPTIFLTHRVNLLHQTAKRFAKRLPHMANKIGIIGDGQYSPNFLTFATVQTLQSIMKKDPTVALDLLSQFKLLIIDEAHRSGSSQFHDAASLCVNASLRLALTATPFLKGNEEEDMWLEAITGNVITSVSAGELIERGILARPFFRFISIATPMERRYTAWRDVYEFGIVRNVARNKQIVIQAMKMVEMKKKTLVICQEVKHGMILEDAMKTMGLRAKFIYGENTSQERDKALSMLSGDKLDIIVCSNIFDEGIDCDDISAVILAAGCKSAPALFQRTGRAVRRKEEDNYAIIIDFLDEHHEKLLEHSMARFEIVRNEPGFVII